MLQRVGCTGKDENWQTGYIQLVIYSIKDAKLTFLFQLYARVCV